MVLAFFGAVFAVNGWLIYAAVSTHTGLVANEPYRKGLAYNERIAAAERQAKLGWFEQLEFGRDGRILLTLAQPDSRPVHGLMVEGVLGRPASNRQDVMLRFIETAPGHYQALAPGMPAGSWLITLEARQSDGAEPIFRLRRRLWLKP
jgi:nitrogen fixation protein FixH